MRTVVALTVLVALFICCGLYAQHYLTQTGAELENMVQAVLNAAQSKDWDEVVRQGEHIAQRWQHIKQQWGYLTEHDEIDDINNTLSRLRAAIASQDLAAIKTEGLSVLHLFQHIPAKEAFTLTNIL